MNGSRSVRVSLTYGWNVNGSSLPALISSATNSTDGLTSWQVRYRDASTPAVTTSQTTYGANGSRTVTITAPDGSYTSSTYSSGQLVSVARYGVGGDGPITQTSYTYDAHGRLSTAADGRVNNTYGYNSADQVTSTMSTPIGTLGGAPQTTATYYNQMLQATNVVNPDGTSVTSVYLQNGQRGETYGSRTFPVAYKYDYDGRVQTMTTWTNFASQLGARTTTWNYDLYRGWPTNKSYPDGAGPIYSNTPAGRLASRAWARGIKTSYAYNAAGDLWTTAYSDNSTPNVTSTYDRLGRLTTINQGSVTTSRTLDYAGDLLSESYAGGPLDGQSVTNAFDQYLRRTGVGLSNQAPTQVQFGYDAASRLQTVTDANNNSATYLYLANSPLVSQIAFANNGATRMTTSKQYDFLNRLLSISSTPTASGQLPVSSAYQYNSANQRTRNS